MSAAAYQRRTDMLDVWWASSFGEWGDGLAPIHALGLDGHATEADINNAYRDLAIIWHPDQPSGSAAALHRIGLARDFVLELLGFSHAGPADAPQDPETYQRRTETDEEDQTEDEALWYSGSGSLWGCP